MQFARQSKIIHQKKTKNVKWEGTQIINLNILVNPMKIQSNLTFKLKFARAHIKEFRILNNIKSRSVKMHKIFHQICVDKSSNLNGISSKTINIKWRRKDNFMGMKINSIFYVSLIASNSKNDAHIFNSYCTFAVRHRKIEEKCLNQTQTLQQNKINIQNRLKTIFFYRK